MSEVELRIRRAEPADSRAVAVLAAELAEAEDPRVVRARIDALIAHPDHVVLVATARDGEVVGWVHAFVARRVQTPPFAEIGGLLVAPDHRRYGVGAALCRRVGAWADTMGLSSVRVRSRSDRAHSASFFETVGFTSTKTQRVFDRPLGDTDPPDS